jgi:hypothetical protein
MNRMLDDVFRGFGMAPFALSRGLESMQCRASA